MSKELSIELVNDLNELKKLFVESAGLAKQAIIKMAQIVKRATDLGFDVRDWGHGMTAIRRDAFIQIANNALLPELYSSFAHKPSFLKLLHTLTPQEQKKIADSGSVRVLTGDENGDYRQVRVDQLTADQVKQVFNEIGGYRSDQGQLNWIEQNAKKSTAKPVEISGFKVGKNFIETDGPMIITKKMMLEWLTRLN